MASAVPAGLKAADISRFALRAGQLDKAKPIVAYWCNYWIVNQILSRGLHNTDAECLDYTSTLMDRLEQFKAANADESAVVDDVAGKAYIEQFGLETFERADKAVRADKASRQTADTYNAAATFLDLLAIWGPLEPEIAAKAKYAKFHAVRIAKAIKAGEDPNLSNPAPEPAPAEAEGEGDGEEGERGGEEVVVTAEESANEARPRQPSVVEVVDESDERQRALAPISTLDQSIHPSRDASVGPSALYSASAADEAPDATSPSLPSPPVALDLGPAPAVPSLPVSSLPVSSLPVSSLPAPSLSAVPSAAPPPVHVPHREAPPQPIVPAQHTVPPAFTHPVAYAVATPQPAPVPAPVPAPAAAAVVDEEAMATAQKHARWAISALNFEDVPTAIKELRAALADLGG